MADPLEGEGGADGDPDQDPGRIQAMFDQVAPDYDRFNRVMSLGLARRWRRKLLEAVDPAPGARILDVGTGTGDLALEAARRAPQGQVLGVDLAGEMLARARTKADGDEGPRARVDLLQSTALRLPLPADAVDHVVSAFALRNVQDLAALAQEATRVLRPGGTFGAVEIHGGGPSLRGRAAGGLFHELAPRVGGLLAGQRDPFRYLSASVKEFPPPSEITDVLAGAGFQEARAHPQLAGVVALHLAQTP